jgi:hypothetical protein
MATGPNLLNNEILQNNFTAGEIAPALYARVDYPKYKNAMRQAQNVFVHAQGGVSNRAGLEFVCQCRAGANINTQLVPFQFNTVQSYVLEFTAFAMRPIMNGGHVLDTVNATPIAAITTGGVFTTAGAHGLTNGREVWIDGVTGMSELNKRHYRLRNVTATTFTLRNLFGQDVSTVAYGAYTGGGTVTPIYEIASPYGLGAINDLVYAQEADVMYFTHVNYPPHKLSRTGHAAWTFTVPTFAPTNHPPTPAPVAVENWSGTHFLVPAFNYVVSSIAAATGEESLPSAPSNNVQIDMSYAGTSVTISWTAVAGAARYVLYKLDNGVYGYIGTTASTSFIDRYITADLSDTPQQGYNPFAVAGNYPRCVNFFQQRLCFASSLNNPQAAWLSQSTSYENFGFSSPAKASDAITFRIRARQVNEIRALLPTKGLMLLTSGAEWTVSGGQQDFISPSQIVIKNEGYRGSAKQQPLVVGNFVLFAQRSGGVIRDLTYEFANDGFTGSDLTLIARHLFEGQTIRSWAYSQSPYSVIWVVLDSGALVSATYLREHDVLAWTRHTTQGSFWDVCVLDENNEDVPYFLVARAIQGQTVFYIERLKTRLHANVKDAFHVDSGLTYSGAPARVISGLDHLEGQTVVALADGNVVHGLVVTDGKVVFDTEVSKAHIGLPYLSEVETVEPDLGAVRGMGTVQGRLKSVPTLTLRVEKTRGLWLGPNRQHMREWKQRRIEPWDVETGMFTGDYEQSLDPNWSRRASIVVQQREPLPMTILGIMAELVIGG